MSHTDEPVRSPWNAGLVPTIHCPSCNALYVEASKPCPICGHELDLTAHKIEIAGVLHEIPTALQGAVPRSSYLLLDRMREEWERPLTDFGQSATRGIPQRFAFVILFWTFFEALMDRFYEAAFADLPGQLGMTLLQRFRGIGSRLEDLYRKRWGVTFWDDLTIAGYPAVACHLQHIKVARNEFIHGNPEAITDELVVATFDQLLDVQLAWIALFNKRCTGMQRHVRLWEPGWAST